MVPETVYTYDIVFFLFRFLYCELEKCRVGIFSTDWLQGQNLKALRVQETTTAMKWKADVRTL